MSSAIVRLDPRTKLFVLVVFNVMMLSASSEGAALYVKYALVAFAALMVVNARRPMAALAFIALYVVASQSEAVIAQVSGMSALGFLIRFFSLLITRMVPGFMVAYAVVVTTTASELIAALERLHVSQKVIIPFAVMLRFFPTIAEESRLIGDAMRMRGVGWSAGPIALLEYRLVPLFVSVVKTADELAAAAVTRGLGGEETRTNYCRIGFGAADVVATALMVAAGVALCVIEVGP